MMKRSSIAVATMLAASLLAHPALADNRSYGQPEAGYADYGNQYGSPYGYGNPAPGTYGGPAAGNDCWDNGAGSANGDIVTTLQSYMPMIVGGVVGGVVGHQFGKGTGRDVMTVAGAILGATVGNEVSKRYRGGGTYGNTQSPCQPVNAYYR